MVISRSQQLLPNIPLCSCLNCPTLLRSRRKTQFLASEKLIELIMTGPWGRISCKSTIASCIRWSCICTKYITFSYQSVWFWFKRKRWTPQPFSWSELSIVVTWTTQLMHFWSALRIIKIVSFSRCVQKARIRSQKGVINGILNVQNLCKDRPLWKTEKLESWSHCITVAI